MSQRSRLAVLAALIALLLAVVQWATTYGTATRTWLTHAGASRELALLTGLPPAGPNIAALHRTLLAMAGGAPLTIAGVGGSVTASHGHKSYGEFLVSWLDLYFPTERGNHTYFNKGVSGATSSMRSLCIDALLGDTRPDLLLLEFAVNDAQDSVTGPASPDTPLHPAENIERMARRALSFDPPVPILLIELCISRRNDIWRGQPLMKGDPRLLLPNVVIGAGSRHASVAMHYGIPIIDGAALLSEYPLEYAGLLLTDGIHLHSAGHALVSALISKELRKQLLLAKLSPGSTAENSHASSQRQGSHPYPMQPLRELGYAPGSLTVHSPRARSDWHGLDEIAFSRAASTSSMGGHLYHTELPSVLFEGAASLDAAGWQCWLGMYGQPPTEAIIKPLTLVPHTLGSWKYFDETGDVSKRKAGWQTTTPGSALVLKADNVTRQLGFAYFKTYKPVGSVTVQLSTHPVLTGTEVAYNFSGHWVSQSQQLTVDLIGDLWGLVEQGGGQGLFVHVTLQGCPQLDAHCANWFKVYGLLQR